MIEKFSNEVIEKIGHYVYRLVDPRNGETFYVGQGKANRVFRHVNAVSMDFYSQKDFITEADKQTEENKDPAKIQRIIEIKKDGLNVIHIIQRWGLSKQTALELETAFIDYFGLERLTNRINGHDDERGMIVSESLEKQLSAETFVDYPNCPSFIIIKITDYFINKFNNNIYDTVRGTWSLSPTRANKYEYVLAVRYGIVVGVFKIDENGWKRTNQYSKKSYFDGTEASQEIKNLFLHKKIPDRFKKKGMNNPAMYCDLKKN